MSTKRKRIPYEVKLAVIKRDGPACRYCGATYRHLLMHLDHIVAKSLGGWDDLDNLQLLCMACNKWKGSNTPTRMQIERHVKQLVYSRTHSEPKMTRAERRADQDARFLANAMRNAGLAPGEYKRESAVPHPRRTALAVKSRS